MTDPRRIVAVRTLLFRLPLPVPMEGPFGRLEARHNLLVEVETAGGIRGLGEIWSNFPPWGPVERQKVVRDAIRPLLLGEVLDDPARLYRRLHGRLRVLANQWGAIGPVHQAIAGTDLALWDAHARVLGLKLRDTLRRDAGMGGRADAQAAPDAVPVYASGIGPHVTAALTERAKAAGHRRFKVRISFGPEVDSATLRAVREAAGPDAPVMADANQTWTPERLAGMAPALDVARLDWLEEPFPVDDSAAYAGWPYRPGLPLAMGENSYGLDGLVALMDTLHPEVMQPDITKTVGFSEGVPLGRRIVTAGARFCPHMFGGSVGLYASAQLVAAVEGADIQEMDANPNPLFTELLDVVPAPRAGTLPLPAGPGLGVTLRPEARARAEIDAG